MNAQDFLSDRSDRHIRFLFKSFLSILEQLQNTHKINFDKLKESLPEKYSELIDMADYFDDDFFDIYRKSVLDIGNSVLREYHNEIETLKVEFKFKN
jgi:hypothetical protein